MSRGIGGSTVVFGFCLALSCGEVGSEPPAPSEPTYVQTVTPSDQPPLPFGSLSGGSPSVETSRIASATHILLVRVAETGAIEETMPDGERRWYDYAWLVVVDPLYGEMEDVYEPYRERFPVFHSTGYLTPDGQMAHEVPSPVSELIGRTGEEVILAGRLPSRRSSMSGAVPAPLAEGGYDAYIVQADVITEAANVQRVMAVVGPE